MILEDLISTNIFQRGIGNINPMKMARCIMELERIKGVRVGKGGDKTSNRDNLNCSQKDLAEDLHMSQRQLSDYKKLLSLIPELQDMILNKELSATVGYKIWARMSHEEQEKFFNDIGHEKIKTLKENLIFNKSI